MMCRLLLALVTVCCLPCAVWGEVTPPEGFTALFNGEDLTGWHGQPHFDPRKLAAMSDEERAAQIEKWTEDARQHWTVENGELVNDGKGAYLTTDREFGDIEFLIEYKTVAKADSGIYLRGTPQVQIWDYTREGGKWGRGADKGSGALFNNSPGSISKEPLLLADKPFGEWNRLRIVQVGSRTSVWLNDALVVDHAVMENYWDRSAPLFERGTIQLQTHGGEIRWRNLFVREIPAEEANALLAARGSAEFESIFNGRDFDGWTGAVENYDVVDGALVCKPGKGGNIFTREEFSDFVVRHEFKLPPAGNNGLLLRYPGTGRASQTAMAEIQILDTEHEKYAKLDPRQFHGSAYGMAAPHRGYLRPTGEWNFQEVTVKGSTIQVELNGTVILETDLSKISEFKDGAPHPGKDRRSGYFGFAGHSDPVEFRNVQVRRLEPVEAIPSWPGFRGHYASPGRVDEPRGVPLKIGPKDSVVWKVPLPPGHSSPVVFGDRIFVTAVRGGEPAVAESLSEPVRGSRATANVSTRAASKSETGPQLVTLCLDRTSGERLWEREAPIRELEELHQIGSLAQCTPATDGEHVVSFFGSAGLFCYNLAGELQWEMPMGPFNNTYGAGTSPVIVDGRVILVQDHDSDSFLTAIDVQTGKTVWKTDRSEFPRNYCSPAIWEVHGQKQIVVAATLRVVGYDFATGKELWTVRGMARSVCMTPVVGPGNMLIVAGWSQGADAGARITVEPFDELIKTRDANENGTLEDGELEKGGDIQRRFDQVDRDKDGSLSKEEYEYYRGVFDQARNVVLAIKPGGRGDITSSHVLWESEKFVPFCASPLAYNGYVFTVKDGGILTNYNARTGELLQTKRVKGTGNYYASPLGLDGRVYLFDREGKLSVIGAYAEWPELWSTEFGEEVYATPAVVEDRLYVRTTGHLYCFGAAE